MKNKRRKILYYTLMTLFSAVFVFSAAYLVNYYVGSQQAGQQYDDLAQQLEALRASLPAVTQPAETTPAAPNPPDSPDPSQPGSTVPVEPAEPPEPTEPTFLPEYAPFYELNNDMVGWLTIPDTKINYPVMQSPYDPDYYLKRNFYKQGSDWGAIYAWDTCDINKPSDNITLFGHHMRDGSMFAQLNKFQVRDFWLRHQTFTFDTLYERHTYRIWAVFKISAKTANSQFPYHRFTDAASEEEFTEFVNTVKRMDFYETGFAPQYGDKLLTMSTCEYTLENGRFVVCAVRID